MSEHPSGPRPVPSAVRVVRTLDDVEPDAWNDLNPRNFRFSYDWLSYIARGPFDAESAFAFVEEDVRYVGAFAAYAIRPEHFFLLNPPQIMLGDGLDALIGDYYTDEERQRAARLREDAREIAAASYPCAVCVSPFGYRVAIETRPERVDTLKLLLEEFDEVARDFGARSKAFLFVPEAGYDDLERVLNALGYRRAAIAARCVLDVEWPTFDEYLASLSADRRRKVKLELQRFRESGLTLDVIDGTDATPDLLVRLGRLSALVQEKYGHASDPELEATVLRGLVEALGERTRLFLVRRDGEVVSYLRGFHGGDTFYCASTGEDHKVVGRRACAHFKVGYYAPIEYAIREGLRRVDWGLGAYEPKLHRGARLEPLIGFFAFGDTPAATARELLHLVDSAQRRFVASRLRRSG